MNRIITILLFVVGFQLPAFAQGPLAPPGAPAPTMLTLNQVEPRTPITNTTAVTISSSGSYYLTTNITVSTGDGIDITASQVTLDLNGFTISSTAASANGTGVSLAGGNTDITILNGHILGSGFVNGINYSGSAPVNTRVSGVSVSGCSGFGIILGTASSTVVDSCTVQTIGVYGIQASSVFHSSAYLCGSVAINANTAENCYGNCSGSGDGFYVGTANDCYGYSSSGYGLYATTATGCYGFTGTGPAGLDANNAINCYGVSNGTGDGLDANNASSCSGYSISGSGLAAAALATGCSGVSTNGTGLSASTANNCYGVSGSNGNGLYTTQTATGCYGQSANSNGLFANAAANNCSGVSNNGSESYGLYAGSTAIGCIGQNTSGGGGGMHAEVAMGCDGQAAGPSGIGLVATIANSCLSNTGDGNITYKYNMP
jgi:hypothetical protein